MRINGLHVVDIVKVIVMVFVSVSLTSCEYKDLCYDHHHDEEPEYTATLVLELKLDLDLDIDVSVEAHTKILEPEYMKVCFYDPDNGALRYTEFVKGYGGPLSTPPGLYYLVAYAFGTEWTQIRNESNVNTLEAFTSDITATKSAALAGFTRSGDYEAPGPIIYTPDHLLVAREPVTIPELTAENRTVTIHADGATIVETYGFTVTNVEGIEYIKSVEAFVTNQASGNFFGTGTRNNNPATIYFPVEVNLTDRCLETSFNTFGKLPGESHSYLHILITDSEGKEYRTSTDITDQFEKADHEIIIDEPIIIPKPEGGGTGIAPTVDEWEEENHDVPIG